MTHVLRSPPLLPSSAIPMPAVAHHRDPSPPPLETPLLDNSPWSSPPSASEPSTPVNHSHSNVVPAYPYNVSMLPQTHNGPTPDDLGITTHLPSICVDYLSHDWEEDDIWTSWKAMTRHKSEIANGVRLENASWRTWAKQRGKLKTISPETLNWCVAFGCSCAEGGVVANKIRGLQAQGQRRDVALWTSAHQIGRAHV